MHKAHQEALSLQVMVSPLVGFVEAVKGYKWSSCWRRHHGSRAHVQFSHLRWAELQAKLLQHFGNRVLCLQRGDPHADAVAGSYAEGTKRHLLQLRFVFWGESVRVKLQWIGPKPRVSLDIKLRNHEACPCLEL